MDYFLDIDGVSLHVVPDIRDIRKPFIVFLHDSLGSVSLWKDFPEKLRKATGLNMVIYDRQGYGKSVPFEDGDRDNDYLEKEADTLVEIIEELDLGRVILFGHSDGGSIALIAAAKYPERISGIITEGAHVLVEEITLLGIRTAKNKFNTTDLKQRLAKYHEDKTQAVFDAWAETWLSDEFRGWNIEHFLPEIKCPALIIQGEDDEYGSAMQVERIAEQVSGKVEVLLLPGVGHTPHKQAADLVLERSAKFITANFPKTR
jgi:pimeloyl-ACP methyl ester carboxylesterase